MVEQPWARLKEIFQGALDRDPDERAAFLEEACGGDRGLRREVERLLASDAESGSFLTPPPPREFARAVDAGEGRPGIGKRLGPYRLDREIASGGMGTVFLASRADQEYEKRVAVKLIKRGMDTDEILLRFRNERQTLANLEHPYIARLLDGGATEDGRPYLVMEHIEGESIDAWCDARSLSIEERIRLFRKVCSAVQSAHQNLVVHRDLKPGNILVTGDGTPKLLDFGIAKLLQPEGSGAGKIVGLTSDRRTLMTPRYASPEQVTGGPITTSSDVYSLGVILYELLTGHRPYDFDTGTRRDLERKIVEREPPRPSTVVEREMTRRDPSGEVIERIAPGSLSRMRGGGGRPERIRRKLSGDLDNIVLMAMRKEPGRRYASAEQLSEDLSRYLAGLPVIARKDTLAYRASKFVRRNRAGVLAACLVAASLVAGIVGTALQAGRAVRAERMATVRAEVAERVAGFLTEVFRLSDPRESPGKSEKTASAILEDAAGLIRDRLGEQPLVRASFMREIGDVYRNIGEYDKAEPLLREALRIDQAELGEENVDTAATHDRLGNLLRELGRYSEAQEHLRRALEVRSRLLGPDDPDLAFSENNLGLVLKDLGKLDEAETHLKRALEARRRIFGERHRRVAYTLGNLAGIRYRRGDAAGAMNLYREALAIREEILPDDHPDIPMNLSNLAVAYRALGKDAEAEKLYRRALDLHLRIYGERNKKVAKNMSMLAAVLVDRGETGEAERLFEKALEIERAVLPPRHPDTAMTLNHLADLLLATNRSAEAKARLEEALGILREAYPGDHRQVAFTLNNLARAEEALGKKEAAAARYTEAMEMYRNLLGEAHPYTLLMEENLASVLVAGGRYAGAEPHLLHLYEVDRAKGGRGRGTGDLLGRLVDLYTKWGRPEKAARYRALLRENGGGEGAAGDG